MIKKQTIRKTINTFNTEIISTDRAKIENIGRSKNTALAIFDTFCKTPQLDITTLCKQTKIPRPTITNTLKLLCNTGIISKVENGKKWGQLYRYEGIIGSLEDFKNNTTQTQNKNGLFLYFNGRERAEKLTNTPTKVKFHPNKSFNSLPNNEKSKNLVLVKDNIDACKWLLPEYSGKLLLAYGDIPFNMPSNRAVLAYNSSFDGTCQLLEHLFPRLELVKKLLQPDGLVALSVSEHEMAYVKVLIDSVYGRENFINNIVIKTSTPASIIVSRTQYRLPGLKSYLLVYAKDKSKVNHLQRLYTPSRTYWQNAFKHLIKKPNSTFGVHEKIYLIDHLKQQPHIINLFKKHNMELLSKNIEKMIKIEPEFKHYMYNTIAKDLYKAVYPKSNAYKSVFYAHRDDLDPIFEYKGKLLEKGSKNALYLRFSDSLIKQEDGSLKNSVILGDIWDVSDTKSTLQNEGHISFSGSKKPVKLITMLLDLIGQRSGVIFEMYGGASVVSHACLLKNKQEGTNFNFIVSQIPEKVDPKSIEGKAGFQTVDQITIKRIQNVIEELGTDDGFKIYY